MANYFSFYPLHKQAMKKARTACSGFSVDPPGLEPGTT